MNNYKLITGLTALVILCTGCAKTSPTLLHERASMIWIMDDAGSRAKSIVAGAMPKWIWGTKTHFAYFVQAKPSIFSHRRGILYVAEWDGTKQSIVGNPLAVTDSESGEHFAWSRDGQWLVFESYRDGNWEIYKVRRDGSSLTPLTKSPNSQDTEPAWTHAGEKNGKIAFVSNRTGDRDIYVMDENGQGLVNLTGGIIGLNGAPDKGDDWGPVWASNADQIAFVGTHEVWGNFSPQIYLTTVSQPGSLLEISDHNSGSFSMPAWEGSESLFYTSIGGSPKVLRRDIKTGNSQVLANLGIVGDQYAVEARFLFIGTLQGIQAIEWHLPGTVSVVGPGLNPNSW